MRNYSRARELLCALACVVLLPPSAGCTCQPETARELGRLDPAAVQLVEYPSASESLLVPGPLMHLRR